MYLSIREASQVLKLGESTVRKHIASGKLSAERVGRQVRITKASVDSMLESMPAGPADDGEDEFHVDHPAPDFIEPVLDRLFTLEKQMDDLSVLIRENQNLFQELRDKDAQLTLKEVEVEKLKRDLVYQKRILDKELEERQRQFEEKRAFIERDFSDRIDDERRQFAEKQAALEAQWSERLARETDNFNLKLNQMKQQEGFWSRLMRMLTWS